VRWLTLGVGVLAGIIFWGGFNTALEATNEMEFCISCHEMRDTVYEEYKETVHFKNPSGVQATCADCHVPRPWVHKVVRKIKATNELYHKAMGTIDTPEKFEAHRLTMAERVWASMKATDSRECRNCHDFSAMDLSEQDRYARKRHERAMDQGQTCIECHQGIAHELPREAGE
jgi:nitrate/TMAO reductase-like tetraheme cytochrome c subunit